MRALALSIAVAVAGAAGVAHADEPAARFSLERGTQPHAGVPFKLLLAAGGFDQDPAPEQPALSIPGATVTPLGAQPNVSRSIEIINGVQRVQADVTWVFSYRIEAASPGRLKIPATAVVQGKKRATAQGASIDLSSVPTTSDMRIDLQLPNRPVVVGETVEADLVWLFRSQPVDWTFSLPMAQLGELTVSAPPLVDRRNAIEVASATKTLDLPFTEDQTEIDGEKWGRVTIKMFVSPHTAGSLAIPASSVVAALAVGPRDFFGNAETSQFRAADVAHTLDVKPLPESDRPQEFAGAVGTAFSIAVTASRSVVQLGEPVDLTITVKSGGRLDALSLPKLDGPGMLPADKFSVPGDLPTGELSDDGKTKTFKVTAQVNAPTTEIPALALAYFDPVKGTYQTVRSEPIALSVAGSAIVNSADVVSASPHKVAGSAAPSELSLVGAELALSVASDARPLGGPFAWVLVALLYLVPLGVFGVRTWQLRTRRAREDAAEVRAARQRVERELARAAKEPARETAGPLAEALRAFAKTLARAPDADVIATIETAGFAPGAGSQPLSASVRDRVAELVKHWNAEARRPAGKGSAAAAVLLVACVGPALLAPRTASAAPMRIDDARASYSQAMAMTDPSARRAAFARAETTFGQLATARPGYPELLADWGNAALEAGDVATATLAYRRALALDPSNARAQRNLAWLRGRAPDALRPAAATGAADALLFFRTWSRATRLVASGIAFAIVVLLFVPWRGPRRRGLALLAIVPAIIWVAMIASVLGEDHHTDDAVVTDSVVLRSADNAGAPAAYTQPLPRGTEVSIVERRPTWTKVRIAPGTTGWVPAGALATVAP